MKKELKVDLNLLKDTPSMIDNKLLNDKEIFVDDFISFILIHCERIEGLIELIENFMSNEIDIPLRKRVAINSFVKMVQVEKFEIEKNCNYLDTLNVGNEKIEFELKIATD